MSTTQTPTQRLVELNDYESAAEDILQGLFEDHGVCNHCFSRKRHYHTEYEESVAEHLVGRNSTVLEMRGHSVTEEGTLLVDSTATSDPDPSTFFEVVPPAKNENGIVTEPARAFNICQCGVVDYDPSDDRSSTELFECVDHIGGRLEEEDTEFSVPAAKRLIGQLKDDGLLGGNDTKVLERAIKLGLKHS